MRETLITAVVAMVLVFGIVTAANATVVVGGYSFDDNAFADYLISSSGSYITSGGSLESCVTGANVDTWAGSWDPGAYLDLGFSDNYIVNGPGNDLALFDLGVEATFEVSVTIGGTTHLYDTFDTGYSGGGYNLNIALVNLDEMECVVVLIRGKRVKITVDPSVPSLKADDEELITEYGNKGTYALLKYDTNNN